MAPETGDVLPWQGPGKPSRAAIEAIFASEGMSPYPWSNGPGDAYPAHSHSYNKVLYCLEGSITFMVSGQAVAMNPGDRLDLAAGTEHAAVVGPSGVVCLEGHR